jgi:hypothetical protein
MLNVLVACEFSGVVRDAFRARGHNAWSCDLLPPEIPKSGLGHIYHLQGDVLRVLDGRIPSDMVRDSAYRNTPLIIKWDLMIAHPECTFLCNSGVRWLHWPTGVKSRQRRQDMRDAAHFFIRLQRCSIPKIAIENPIPHKYAKEWIGMYDQIFQPWQFGHKEMKATCLWLKNLPPLEHTKIVGPPPRDPVERRKWARVHRASPGPDRWKERSRTLPGIAAAMAAQWG